MFALFKKGRGNNREAHRREASRLRQPQAQDRRENYVFRRSRTLTGSAANAVKTSAVNRTDLQSERLKLHELHQRRRALFATAFSSVAMAFGIWYLLASTIIGAHVVVDGHEILVAGDEQKIIQTVQQYVNNYPTEAFAMSLNAQRFSTYMQRAYPEIRSIRLESNWLGLERAFHISYRQALAAWQIGGKSFYIDAEGVAFTTLYGSEPKLRVEDTSSFIPADGSSVASKRFIRYLGQMLAAIQAKQVGAVERVVIPAATRELDVFLKDRPYPIKTHTDRDPYKQVDDMTAALGFLDEKKLKPAYLDVRVEGRAYYK